MRARDNTPVTADTRDDVQDDDAGSLVELGYDRLSARSRWELLAYAALISSLAATTGWLGAAIGVGVVVTRLFVAAPYAFALGHASVIAAIPPTIGLAEVLLVEAAFVVLLGVPAVGHPHGREIAIGTLGGALILLWPLRRAAAAYPLWVVALSLLGGFAVLLSACLRYDLVALSTTIHQKTRATRHRLQHWLGEEQPGAT